MTPSRFILAPLVAAVLGLLPAAGCCHHHGGGSYRNVYIRIVYIPGSGRVPVSAIGVVEPEIFRDGKPSPATAPSPNRWWTTTTPAQADHEASIDTYDPSFRMAAYPRDAMDRGVSGVAALLVLVDPRGHAAAISIEYSSGDAGLDAAAVGAAWHWKYNPKMVKGVARASILRVPVKFGQAMEDLLPRKDLPGGGENYPQTDRQALEDLTDQARAGAEDAQLLLGSMYFQGLGVPRDGAKAVGWLQTAAARGSAPACMMLGRIHSDGRYQRIDGRKALAWYERAYAAGDASADLAIAMIHGNGTGVPVDAAKARQHYERAASRGDIALTLDVVEAYAGGRGVPKDTAHAVELLDAAARRGDDEAKMRVGAEYVSGRIVPQDAGKAKALFDALVGKGAARGNCGIGSMYAGGVGVAADPVQALGYYQKCAAAGDAQGQYDLGMMYVKGSGVPADWILGYAWLSLAADKGHADAIERRDFVQVMMNKSQVAKATRLASTWKPGQVLVP